MVSIQNVPYCIIFSCDGIAVQVSMLHVPRRYTEKVQEILSLRLVLGFRHVCLSTGTSLLPYIYVSELVNVKNFFRLENVTMLTILPRTVTPY